MKHITNECPYCLNILQVDRMSCKQCEVHIEAEFPATRLAHLPTEHQRFIEMFVLAGGNLKEIAKLTGVSYPTIRSRLNKVIDSLRSEIGKEVSPQGTPLDALISLDGKSPAKRARSDESILAEKLIKSI